MVSYKSPARKDQLFLTCFSRLIVPALVRRNRELVVEGRVRGQWADSNFNWQAFHDWYWNQHHLRYARSKKCLTSLPRLIFPVGVAKNTVGYPTPGSEDEIDSANAKIALSAQVGCDFSVRAKSSY